MEKLRPNVIHLLALHASKKLRGERLLPFSPPLSECGRTNLPSAPSLVLFAAGWLDRDWTWSPNFVQCLSNNCPTFVQVQALSSPCPTVSKLSPMSVKQVKTLSNGCQVHVQAKTIGQALDMKIQYFSRFCPIIGIMLTCPQLDKIWQTLDLDKPWTNMSFYVFNEANL